MSLYDGEPAASVLMNPSTHTHVHTCTWSLTQSPHLVLTDAPFALLLRVYDAQTGALVHRISNQHADIIVALAFHPTGAVPSCTVVGRMLGMVVVVACRVCVSVCVFVFRVGNE